MASGKTSGRSRDKRNAEFAMGMIVIFLVAAVSFTALLGSGQPAHVKVSPTGFAAGDIPESDRIYVDYENEVIPAGTDYIVTLETSAEEGGYLAYELDGEYRTEVLVQNGNIIQLLLNLNRGLHEIRVYVPPENPISSTVLVERHMIVAV